MPSRPGVTMTKVVKTILINAPISKVFEKCDNPNAMPLYVPSVTSVSNVQRSEKRIGDTFRATYGMMGAHFDEDFTYTEFERDKRIKAAFEGAMKGTMGITLVPQGNSTNATLESEYEVSGGILGKAVNKLLFERINDKNAERLLENLKMVCEFA
ncbi:SRPBCC family protein [Candidatus Bathyarchaeota archaeon]|nr:MAG: SRPBCC family protein [Candidatus Bathyarchaeota archaeon]